MRSCGELHLQLLRDAYSILLYGWPLALRQGGVNGLLQYYYSTVRVYAVLRVRVCMFLVCGVVCVVCLD